MRLLNVRTRQLEEYHGNDIPKYSILSHRWGDEEVTFNDINGENGPPDVFEGKAGYRKIDYACRQALADGFDYTWVDTCCINKASSAELTESINSMFSWYQDAETCYAYLSDVPDDSERPFLEELAHRSSRTFEHDRQIGKTAFAKSGWWSRSWTLQELLAPPTVFFFAENWTFLGTRGDLASVIHTITHIDTAVLLGLNEPKHCCVARRMSWAARRNATRVEDIAYALLGLFGINMPLLYGEGENAFKRLQQEIIRSSDDQSVFAWNYGAKSPPLLAPSPRHFTLCYDVVRWKSPGSGNPYTLTNSGLSITLPIYRNAENGRMYAALGCRRETNFTDCLALEVRKPSDSDDKDNNHIIGVNGRRLDSVPADKLPSAKEVLFAWDPFQRLQRAYPSRQCLFRLENHIDPVDLTFAATCCSPPEWWNTRMTHLRVNDYINQECFAGYRNVEGFEFAVSVFARDKAFYRASVTSPIPDRPIPKIAELPAHQEQKEEDEERPAALATRGREASTEWNSAEEGCRFTMSIGGSYSIAGSLEKTVLMGEEVYVVDIKVHVAGTKTEDCPQCTNNDVHKSHEPVVTASRTLTGNTSRTTLSGNMGIQRRLVPRSTF